MCILFYKIVGREDLIDKNPGTFAAFVIRKIQNVIYFMQGNGYGS